jgi:GNAT superfamily N-acetyltransferase
LVAVDGSATVGCALVLPPGQWRTPIGVQARHTVDFARAFGWRLGHAVGLVTELERMHPRYPHYYLPFIGVVTAAQGHGVGGTLLAELGRRCDGEGLPAYLEASSPDNARLYRRHGFETIRVVRPLGSPPLELMVRRPSVTGRG